MPVKQPGQEIYTVKVEICLCCIKFHTLYVRKVKMIKFEKTYKQTKTKQNKK